MQIFFSGNFAETGHFIKVVKRGQLAQGFFKPFQAGDHPVARSVYQVVAKFMRILVNPLAPVIAVRIELYLMTAVLQINFGIIVLITYQAAFLAYGFSAEPTVEVVLHHAQEHGNGCFVKRSELRAFNKSDNIRYFHIGWNFRCDPAKVMKIRHAAKFFCVILDVTILNHAACISREDTPSMPG